MIFFIPIAAQVFSIAFRRLQGEALVHDMLAFLPGGEVGALLFLMLLLFVLGFFLERIEISYIALPLVLPFFVAAGTDMVWLAALIALNLSKPPRVPSDRPMTKDRTPRADSHHSGS